MLLPLIIIPPHERTAKATRKTYRAIYIDIIISISKTKINFITRMHAIIIVSFFTIPVYQKRYRLALRTFFENADKIVGVFRLP